MIRGSRRHPGPAARAGFTLMELIVVMAAIVLLLAVAVPSFSAMIASQRRTLAQTQLQSAIVGARALALQQFRGTDTAAVFTFEPNGRLSIVACVQVGSIPDTDDPEGYRTSQNPSLIIDRDVFIPDPAVQPVSLPGGWMLRGLVTESELGLPWFPDPVGPGSSRWVFPESGFYDKLEQLDGDDRQTFMVRFEGGTGRVKADGSEALVLLRRPSNLDRTPAERELLDAEDPSRFVRLRQGDDLFMSLDPGLTADRAYMLGNLSSDTVLAKPAWALALYRERELANALGLGLDDDTGSLYDTVDSPTMVMGFDLGEASNWLETGDVTGNTEFGDAVPGALLFAFNRADGSLVDLIEASQEAGTP